ncbi:MAG TPA: MAPEG family protein [Rhizomicrobium sp.]|nr:MAPEG family protein [Rhizomicrobium sp.]
MNTDLQMLTATAVLMMLLITPYGLYMWTHWPLGAVLGNRQDVPELPQWAQRARRAQLNMLENFPHFAALVIVANMAGFANEWTALGATIFFWARLVHAIVYTTGTWQLRAPAFFAGLGAEILILWQIISQSHLLG